MYLEVRQQGKKKKYYLSHDVRWVDKKRILRIYLGSNLSEEELDQKKKEAEPRLRKRVIELKMTPHVYPIYKPTGHIGLEEIKKLSNRREIKIIHLTEDDWKRFTELFTYHTNAIEGSAVTFTEVINVLEKGEWPKEKTREEISETYGVAEAVKYIRETKEELSADLIKHLHFLIFKNSKAFAGKFREGGTEVGIIDSIGRVVHVGAPAEEINTLLKELVKWYENHKRYYPHLLLGAVVHNQFELIHPFEDGNGRVGRLILNNVLIKHKLPPVNIELKNRRTYYNALRSYQKNRNIRPMIELIVKEYRELRKTLK